MARREDARRCDCLIEPATFLEALNVLYYLVNIFVSSFVRLFVRFNQAIHNDRISRRPVSRE